MLECVHRQIRDLLEASFSSELAEYAKTRQIPMP